MPFANYCGGIARLTKELGESLLVSVEFITVNKETVRMGVLTRLYRSTHGTTDRVCYIALLEKHTIPSQRIDIWGGAMLF